MPETPSMAEEPEFKVNDKVVCVDDSIEVGPWGPFPMRLKIGAIYCVHAVFMYKQRGETLLVGDDGQYSKAHFRLVSR